MKIAYVSGVKFGYDLLSHLLEHKWQTSIIFSYSHNKQKLFSDSCSFDSLAEKYKIKHIKVDNINDPQNIDLLKTIEPDLLLVMGWSQLLKNNLLEIPKIGTIGSHPTELPKYRGRAPIPWSILKNLKESALTFFWIEQGIDNGDILDQRKFSINETDDASTLYHKITEIGKSMILENLSLIQAGKIRKTKQDESKFVEYWQKRTPEDGMIDWNKSAKEIHTLIRACTYPYPGAFTFFRGSKLKIWKADYIEKASNLPGKIIDIGKNGVEVGTGNGVLVIKIVSFSNYEKIEYGKLLSSNDIGIILGKQK